MRLFPSKKLGVLLPTREESSMSVEPEAPAQLPVKDQIQQKLAELAQLMSVQEYAPDGPPQDLTFREIERVGYEAAQLAAAKFESTVTSQHLKLFEGPQACPQCGDQCEAKGSHSGSC